MSVLLVLMLLMFWVNGHAIEFTVNTTNDSVDADIADGLCLDSNGECSLRAAIMQSNILGSADVVYLPRGNVYELMLNSDINTQAANDLDIFDSITLSIADPEIPIETLSDMPAISAGALVADRVFEIHGGAQVNFKGLFITSGDADNSLSNPRQGGAIYVSDQVGEFRISDSIVFLNKAGYGAGIYSEAEVTWIEKTDVSYNFHDSIGLPLLGAAGAAIYHKGLFMNIIKSSIHNNSIDSLGFFASAVVLNGTDSQVEILNTLIADNGVWPFGDDSRVDGIRINQGDLRVNNSNIVGNQGFGLVFDDGGDHVSILRNSVLAFNVFDNCGEFTGVQDFGGFMNPAYIVSSDLSCSLPTLLSGNKEDVDPQLSELEGRFQTILDVQYFITQYPKIGSVLIDAGSRLDVGTSDISACEATDIRGVERPLTGGFFNYCDVGIYEADDLIFKTGFELID